MSKFDIEFIDEKPTISNKISSFFITVNTQKAYTDVDEALVAKEALKVVLRPILDNIDQFLQFFITEPGNVKREIKLNPEQLDHVIVSGSVRTAVEIGKEKHRLHSHTMLMVEHLDYTIRVNLDKVREYLPKGYHLDVRFISDHKRAMEVYMSKTFN